MNYRSVVIFGQGQEVNEPAQKLRAMRCVVEYIIPGRWEDARQPNEQEFAAMLVVRVPLDECSAKVRTGPPVDDEEDLSLPVWAGVVPSEHSWLPAEPDELMKGPTEVPEYVAAYDRPSKSTWTIYLSGPSAFKRAQNPGLYAAQELQTSRLR